MSVKSSKRSDRSRFRLRHEIFVLDAFLCAALDCGDRERITREFLRDMLHTLGMQPLAPADIFPATDERAPGWSFIQPITTSHVSAHYFARPGRLPNLRLDAYSCEPFDWQAVVNICHCHFSLERWCANLIRRRIDKAAMRSVRGMEGHGASVTRQEPLVDAGRDQLRDTNEEPQHRMLT